MQEVYQSAIKKIVLMMRIDNVGVKHGHTQCDTLSTVDTKLSDRRIKDSNHKLFEQNNLELQRVERFANEKKTLGLDCDSRNLNLKWLSHFPTNKRKKH